MSDQSRSTRRRRWVPWVITALIVALLAASGYLVFSGLNPGSKYSAAEAKEPKIVLDDPPSQTEIDQMDPQPASGDLRVPAVDMSTDLKTMNEVGGVINPPDLYPAFVINGHATPKTPEDGTTIIALHSVQGATLPGNKLINVAAGTPAVSAGQEVIAQDRSFTIDKAYSVTKSDISDEEDVWSDEPGKLVILTCLQRTAGKSVENVIIIAHSNELIESDSSTSSD